MSTAEEKLARLRRFNSWVRMNDAKLAEESRDVVNEAVEIPSPGEIESALVEESVILRRERPVLSILNNETQLVFIDPMDSAIWEARLRNARPMLDHAIRAVGRIDLQGGRLDWVGTGWLVADDILVTNRHVANEFAMRKGEVFAFRMGNAGPMTAGIDFLHEIGNSNTLVFRLIRPLHIEALPGPDLSFFEIEQTSGDSSLAKPIELATELIETENAATIGYPAYDSRIPEPELMEQIFGRVYNKKRLAPGAVTRVEETRILHNCTTLGGNSGSVVLDLDNGKAVGLHFSGSFLTTNYAIRADVVKKLLERVRSGRVRPEPPLQNPTQPAPPALVAKDTDITQEAVAADYDDRNGYQPDFLGTDEFFVQLPAVERDSADVLDFAVGDKTGTELRYQHYSVVMSRSRRMCFLSAVNIDGGLAKKTRRAGWKWDPRIPKTQQIMDECYGSPPRFSRGHMTRREDPAWGNISAAKLGNEDSMHVTNTTPQMQAFNSPIWLALEDYALGHAREDAMKISVFTGPYFHDDDPTMYGVRIPVTFWKVIAFIHDETGKLCATGYEMNQEQSLQPEEEFVFGQFVSPQLNVTTQVPILSIQKRSGVNFGRLVHVDPLANVEESAEAEPARVPLAALEQIRFL